MATVEEARQVIEENPREMTPFEYSSGMDLELEEEAPGEDMSQASRPKRKARVSLLFP